MEKIFILFPLLLLSTHGQRIVDYAEILKNSFGDDENGSYIQAFPKDSFSVHDSISFAQTSSSISNSTEDNQNDTETATRGKLLSNRKILNYDRFALHEATMKIRVYRDEEAFASQNCPQILSFIQENEQTLENEIHHWEKEVRDQTRIVAELLQEYSQLATASYSFVTESQIDMTSQSCTLLENVSISSSSSNSRSSDAPTTLPNGTTWL